MQADENHASVAEQSAHHDSVRMAGPSNTIIAQ